jgi:WD40 repeat protein
VDTGALVWKIDGCRTGGVNVVRFLSEKYLATVGMDAIVRIWKRSSSKKATMSPPKQVRSMKGHSNLVTSMATWTAPDGEIVVITGSYDGTARLWNLKTGNCIRVLSGHDGGLESISVIQCEKDLLVCVSRYRAIRIWDLNTGETIKTVASIDPSTVGKPPTGPAAILILRDMIMTTCDDLPTIKIWKATSRDQIIQRQSPRPVF